MSKRKEKKDAEERVENYYKLHTQAVDDLVGATSENTERYSQEELNRYKRHKKGFHIPRPLKLGFVKFWFPAAVCFFFFWGLGVYLPNMLDLLFVTGIALGVVTDLLTNNSLRFLAEYEGENDDWMMFPKKGFVTFPLNIAYAFLVLFLVYTIYFAINTVIVSVRGLTGEVPLGVGPILFGLFYLLCDTLLIQLKLLFRRILEDAKEQASRPKK